MIPVTLAMSGDQYAHLQSFLFPGDGFEAVAILLCGRRYGDRRHRLTVHEVHDIPYDQCERTQRKITWHTDTIADILERATAEKLSVVKVHSHPGGYAEFSEIDDEGDARLLPMIKGYVEANVPHGSAVMLPKGEMFGRVLGANGKMHELASISVAGDDLKFWYRNSGTLAAPNFVASHAQAFDDGTIERMQRMSFAVLGASGTGSPVFEQLMRLGAGEIVAVDDDVTEERNINRILNSTMEDAVERRMKVDVLAAAATRAGLGT